MQTTAPAHSICNIQMQIAGHAMCCQLTYLEGQLSQLYILLVWLRLQVALQWCIGICALILN